MKLYQFSPINDEETIKAALAHIQAGLRKLSELCLEEVLPINTLKIFAHYQEEYEYLFDWINKQGGKSDASSSTSYYMRPSEPLTVNGDTIELVGLRVPDPYRSQVGCGDFVVSNFEEFKPKYLNTSSYIREVPHSEYELLELFHPDIDVLGYIVKG